MVSKDLNIELMNLDNIIMLIAVVVIFIVILKLIFGPLKKILGFLINSVIGAILLLIVNYFGASFGITVGINLLTAMIAGILGIPGVVLLIIFQKFI